MRSLIVDGLKVGAPFDRESEAGVWRSVRIQPAHVTLALRVQARAVEQYAPSVFHPQSLVVMPWRK